MDGLFEMVKSPREVLTAMLSDKDVFVEAALKRGAWYLRVYLHLQKRRAPQMGSPS
jgi:hypothetical protein